MILVSSREQHEQHPGAGHEPVGCRHPAGTAATRQLWRRRRRRRRRRTDGRRRMGADEHGAKHGAAAGKLEATSHAEQMGKSIGKISPPPPLRMHADEKKNHPPVLQFYLFLSSSSSSVFTGYLHSFCQNPKEPFLLRWRTSDLHFSIMSSGDFYEISPEVLPLD